MLCTGAGHAAGQNLAALAGETAKPGDILIIDVLNLFNAELANLPTRLAATRTAYAIASIFRQVSFLLMRFKKRERAFAPVPCQNGSSSSSTSVKPLPPAAGAWGAGAGAAGAA